MVKSGHRQKPSAQGALTLCRAQREDQVKLLKETERARGTHELLSAQGGSSQDTERNQAHEGHSQTVKCTGDGQDKTLKESKYARGTHRLSSTQGGSSKGTNRN
jgi:hypothetical protein